jgi:hypothetical protein
LVLQEVRSSSHAVDVLVGSNLPDQVPRLKLSAQHWKSTSFADGMARSRVGSAMALPQPMLESVNGFIRLRLWLRRWLGSKREPRGYGYEPLSWD